MIGLQRLVDPCGECPGLGAPCFIHLHLCSSAHPFCNPAMLYNSLYTDSMLLRNTLQPCAARVNLYNPLQQPSTAIYILPYVQGHQCPVPWSVGRYLESSLSTFLNLLSPSGPEWKNQPGAEVYRVEHPYTGLRSSSNYFRGMILPHLKLRLLAKYNPSAGILWTNYLEITWDKSRDVLISWFLACQA